MNFPKTGKPPCISDIAKNMIKEKGYPDFFDKKDKDIKKYESQKILG